jgi:N-acetyl-S-(2-succino)cysteine monooxygenase
MSHTRRQMHLAVFWLGTGNHIAGWRMPGAFDSNCSWPIAEAGVKIAERGKFDLFFISDSLAPDLAG